MISGCQSAAQLIFRTCCYNQNYSIEFPGVNKGYSALNAVRECGYQSCFQIYQYPGNYGDSLPVNNDWKKGGCILNKTNA